MHPERAKPFHEFPLRVSEMDLKRTAAMFVHLGLCMIEKRLNRRERVRYINRREDRDGEDAAAKRVIDPRCQQAA